MTRHQSANKPKIAFMLVSLTMLFVLWQACFFLINFSIAGFADALTGASITAQAAYPVIFVPVLIYFACQAAAYALFTGWIWFVAVSLTELFSLSNSRACLLGLILWCSAALDLLALNNYYFPASYFSQLTQQIGFNTDNINIIIYSTSILLFATSALSFYQFFRDYHYRKMGWTLLAALFCITTASLHDKYFVSTVMQSNTKEPNIIIIGIDSLRPDFTSYSGNQTINTPNIDLFLQQSLYFTDAYTSLARTFPSWISILTGKFPMHSGARNNLVNQEKPLAQDNLARHLQQAGYTTIYASDEKRFSNITKSYGFDQLIGPKMGANDFLLGGLSDAPMSNLLVSSAIGRLLFPFNYGNRAAAITYYPAQFMQQLKIGLQQREASKPLFASIHLCLPHWPFTWADAEQQPNAILPTQYRQSVERADQQFAAVMQLLQASGLLNNSLLILLSDHGTTLGMPDDRLIKPETYHGDKSKIKYIPVSRFSNTPKDTPNESYYSINTIYGQGTSVLSLKQHHVLLAFKRYGGELPVKTQNGLALLPDVAPTILDYLHLPALKKIDGISLLPYLSSAAKNVTQRPLFLETGDSFSEIETDHIKVDKVIKHEIGIYEVDAATGLLSTRIDKTNSILKNKELAIIQGDWLLAHFPAHETLGLIKSDNGNAHFTKRITKPYFVIYNLKTNQWTIGLNTAFAKQAPTNKLLAQLKAFYPGEVTEESKASTN